MMCYSKVVVGRKSDAKYSFGMKRYKHNLQASSCFSNFNIEVNQNKPYPKAKKDFKLMWKRMVPFHKLSNEYPSLGCINRPSTWLQLVANASHCEKPPQINEPFRHVTVFVVRSCHWPVSGRAVTHPRRSRNPSGTGHQSPLLSPVDAGRPVMLTQP
jgi:hypothetical protein